MAFDFASAAETLKGISVVLAIVMAAYAGFILATSRDVRQRGEWKEMLGGIALGLILLYLAPLLASQVTGGNYCGVGG